MKVLIAEDDPISRRILEANLKSWGYDVATASDGDEAWDMVKDSGIPLVILDWMLPGIDGLELCRRIRARRESEYTYIIFLTSKEEKKDIITALDAGADDYIAKPFHQEEFRSRVKGGERVIRLERNLQDANSKLQILAITDSLTGLYNHGAILSRMGEELIRCQREGGSLSLIMADIDFFKKINDNHGHIAGDRVLIEVASRIKNICRPYDSVGRYGGEEFLVILPGTDAKEAWRVAERLHDCIRAKPFDLGEAEVPVTISVGVGTVPWELKPNEESIIKAVDMALYRAKEMGRDRVQAVIDKDYHLSRRIKN